MAKKLENTTGLLIEQTVKQARLGLKGSAGERFELFAQLYFTGVVHEDIATQTPQDLAGQTRSILGFLGKRKPGRALVRVFNPEYARDGWNGNHTVIEIINDDMPFLVDSVRAALNFRGYGINLVIHPIIAVTRDKAGTLKSVKAISDTGNKAKSKESFRAESIIHMEIDRQATASEIAEIKRALNTVTDDVRSAVKGWMPMRNKLAEIIDGLPAKGGAGVEEVREFLKWLDDDHFTFLGYRRYDFTTADAKGEGAIVRNSGLGILSKPSTRVFTLDNSAGFGKVRRQLAASELVTIAKANRRSTVHRSVHMDTIGINIMDARGKTVGEHRFIGLFTSHAYSLSPRFIPLLRRKIERVIAKTGLKPSSHDGKALLHTLETYPRDELFQISEGDLLESGLGILHLQERQRTALFTRKDPFGRFVSCLVYTPKEEFGTPLREQFETILCAAFNGTVSTFYTHIGDEPLARVHFIIKTDPGRSLRYDHNQIEADLAVAARSWADELRDDLVAAHGERDGLILFDRYKDSFAIAYRESFSATQTIHDIEKIESLVSGSGHALNLYRRQGAEGDALQLKIYQQDMPIPLSDVLPMLENMGLRVMAEVPFSVACGPDKTVWIHDFELRQCLCPDEKQKGPGFAKIKEVFEEAFACVMRGDIEDDGYNQLVLAAALGWRDVVLLRAYSKYLWQIRAPFSQDYMICTVASNPGFARMLVDLFVARFDPKNRKKAEARAVILKVKYEAALEAVQSLDEDRILRRFLNLVLMTLRTNYYQPDSADCPKSYVSFKLASDGIDDLPLPRPWREIFVYSPSMEGIHLRGGPVARGGIRWSDRREDFRTEILGLMKAQVVKNPVIVPTGAKGGFVVKRPPLTGGREAFLAEGIECYKDLMRGLLDITDNRSGDHIIPPKDVVRHDGDDPYLVVAADKGTATFSDIANGVSRDYGFWLDDAFASGGSVGYDHKKMGITARGAWESVKRHFRETGKNIQKQDFTVVGVGDMAGDVFGNGMLLSRHIQLVAAFNHMHIFIDPDPDPDKSFVERQRLFKKPRSSWTDYDKKLISKGGGIFERSAKSIPLSPELKKLLGISQGSLSPDDLVRHLLMAEVDLLWFGGIGTFVKAAGENNADAGDRANDGVRINGADLQCKVLGEGANLGITQAGRIEYAQNGGRLNADSVDNSAGVDCSDHEVNIKILLGQLVDSKKLTMKARDKLLKSMTAEVSKLVLRDNYLQTAALSIAQSQAPTRLPNAVRLIRSLEKIGLLDRVVEGLPDEEALAQLDNAGAGLTRPEIVVLLAYAKIALKDELMVSDLPDDKFLVDDLVEYFPTPIRKNHKKAITDHRLAREIVATSITNQIINRGGFTFVNDLKDRSGCDAIAVAQAFIIVRDAFDCGALWDGIEALDNKVDAALQLDMLQQIAGFMERATLWFLQNGDHPLDMGITIELYRPGIKALAKSLSKIVSADDQATANDMRQGLVDRGVPKPLAGAVTDLSFLNVAPDIIRISDGNVREVAAGAQIYFGVGHRFGFDWLRGAALRMDCQTPWQRQAVQAIVDDLYGLQYEIVAHVMEVAGDVGIAGAMVDIWADDRKNHVARCEQMLADMQGAANIDVSMLAVALRQLRQLVTG